MNHYKFRNAFVIGTLASAMAMVATGCGGSDDTGGMMDSGMDNRGSMEGQDSDNRLRARVEADLAAESSLSASASDIDVAISNGVVTLSGEVSDAAARSAAERAARGVDGVQRVRNDLTLAQSSMALGSEEDRRTDSQAGGREGRQAGTEGNYGDNAERNANSMGDAVSDTWITTKVKSELLSDDISSGFDVDVETNDGWVTLSGQLGNREAVDHIRNLVENVDGVRGVDISNLSVVAQN